MQFYNFIFLARSWASDRVHLAKSLSWLGARAEKQDIPLTFILYPEGTLVSKDTRPISKKYADKLGIVSLPFPSSCRALTNNATQADMQHMLLPRSTGLHHSLRSLAPRIPSLKMIDITMAYPGERNSNHANRNLTSRPFRYSAVQIRAVLLHYSFNIPGRRSTS